MSDERRRFIEVAKLRLADDFRDFLLYGTPKFRDLIDRDKFNAELRRRGLDPLAE